MPMEALLDPVDVPSVGPRSTDQGEVIPETPRVSKFAFSVPWEPSKLQDKACFLGTH